MFFCIFLIFSPIGKLKLGKPNDKPEFNTVSWFAMLFSAGMGIGLVFYGAAEPMADFASPPNADPKTTEDIQKHYVLHFSTGDSMLGLYMV